jgi:hypothetical protein
MNKLLFNVLETKYILIEGHVLHSSLDSLKLKTKNTNLMKNILLHTDLGITNTKMNNFFIHQIVIYFFSDRSPRWITFSLTKLWCIF